MTMEWYECQLGVGLLSARYADIKADSIEDAQRRMISQVKFEFGASFYLFYEDDPKLVKVVKATEDRAAYFQKRWDDNALNRTIFP